VTGRTWLIAGALWGLLAVGLGAMAAHGLEDRLAAMDPDGRGWFETGATYCMYHALALAALGAAAPQLAPAPTKVAGIAFVAGNALFSGSLFALGLTGAKALGMITPFGGLALMAGWVAFAVAAWRGREAKAAPGSEPRA